MCCWGYEDVYLEEAPPKKEPEPEKDIQYIMVDSNPPKPADAPVAAPVGQVFSYPCEVM